MHATFFRRALVVGGLLVVAISAGVMPVQATNAPGWRIVKILRHCGNDGTFAVVATAHDDAWALGAPYSTGASCLADLVHWNGASWRRLSVPRGVYPGSFLNWPLAASSASDVWIFPATGAFPWGGSSYAYNYALRWNGRRWISSRFPRKLMVQSAVAFSGKDAWAFGSAGSKTGSL